MPDGDMPNIVVLLAGGSGSRMRGAVEDKVMAPLRGMPVLLHSLRAFAEAGVAEEVVIVHRDAAQRSSILGAMVNAGFGRTRVTWAVGGAERRDSVLSGLTACPAGAELVFIHDGARPLVRPESLRELAAVASRTGAAVLASRVKDTVKQAPVGAVPGAASLLRDLDRSTLWAMQTPQVFRHDMIQPAYREVLARGEAITDDVAAAVACGHAVAPVENLWPNPKITEPADLAWCEFLLDRS